MYDYFMDDKNLYQIFITGTGEYLNELLTKGLGGVIFFTKDITSEENFKSKIKDIKSHSIIKPFLSIDQEGGRVERTENIYAKRLSAKYAFQKGENFLKSQTELIANELLGLGINLNFAPVADVNTNPNNPIIGERAYGDNPQDVIRAIKLITDIYSKKGLIACAKHYPGHGDANADSHKVLPNINLSLQEMEETHLPPFKFASEINIPMIMVAHLNCQCFNEPNIPTTLSKNAINYLRHNLNYNGVIISDDMNMGGVTHLSPIEAAIKALKAGVNILLYRDANQQTYDTINTIIKEIQTDKELELAVIQSVKRISNLKALYL